MVVGFAVGVYFVQCEQKHLSWKRQLVTGHLRLIKHYVGSVEDLFSCVSDPRRAASVDYPLSCVFYALLLMFLCRLRARQHITSNLRDGSMPARGLFGLLFDVDMVPHDQTVNYLACRVQPEQVQDCVVKLIRSMIRMKQFDSSRLLGRHHRIAFDGTQVFSFGQRHCAHCLTKVSNGVTTYYHMVLEAKILLGDNMALSVMSEFVENESEGVTKQDCETKAFIRLCERLKAAFPRLDVCVLLDSLYAQGPVFGLCERYGWKYIINFKEGSIPTVQKEYQALLALEPSNLIEARHHPQGRAGQTYKWIEGIAYQDSHGKWHNVNVFECVEAAARTARLTTFRYISNITPDKQSVPQLVAAGRSRWKIENNGFNVQKNQDYGLEHSYTKHPTGWKVFYLVMQIATIIEQMLTHSKLIDPELHKSARAVRNLASKILEAIRNYNLDRDTLRFFLEQPFQVRFHSP